MSSDEDEPTEEQEFFLIAEKNVRSEMVTALLAANLDTMDKLLSEHGMGDTVPSDAAIVKVLTKLKAIEPSIDLGIMNNDAGYVRLLARKGQKGDIGTPPSKKARKEVITGTAADDAEDTKVSKKAFDKLATLQNVKVEDCEQLDHNFMRRMDTALRTTGTINMAVELKMCRRQQDKRSGFRRVGDSTKLYEFKDATYDEAAEGRMSHPAIAEAILLFVDGLAAVLGTEPKGGRKGSQLLLSKGGARLEVVATHHEVLVWGKVVMRACGSHIARFADGIFNRAFNKQMELAKIHGFAAATTQLSQNWPKMLEPVPAEKLAFEKEQKARELKDKQEGERRRLDAQRRKDALGRGRVPGKGGLPPGAPAGPKRTPEGQHDDEKRQPCHGIAYHGKCNKGAECVFDHNPARCAAFRVAHPEGVRN